MLPSLQRDYLTRPDLERRVLRLVRREYPSVNFVPVVRDGERYRLENAVRPAAPYTDVNLVFSGFRVVLDGKATNEPRVTLTDYTQ